MNKVSVHDVHSVKIINKRYEQDDGRIFTTLEINAKTSREDFDVILFGPPEGISINLELEKEGK